MLAQEEARRLGHNFIGTEHLLLGLIEDGEGVAAKALESLGISLEAVREKVRRIVGPGGTAGTGSPPFTPGAKKVLEFSLREALQLGHNYIGTEHILLGLVREGQGVAAQVLGESGADPARVRREVIDRLSDLGGPASVEGGSSLEPPMASVFAVAQAPAVSAPEPPLCRSCRAGLAQLTGLPGGGSDRS